MAAPEWLRRLMRRPSASPKPAPVLPPLSLKEVTKSQEMTSGGWSYEEAAISAASLPTPPKTPATAAMPTLMAVSESSLNSARSRENPNSATATSKTSQYIEKITAENERLRRELNAEKLAREEEAKRVGAARVKAEDSRADLQNLQLLLDANTRALERKDRKLAEVTAQLEAEKKRRIAAEARETEALGLLDEARTEHQRQIAIATELKMRAETDSTAARDGFRRVTEGYERKVRAMNQELKELRQERLNQSNEIRKYMKSFTDFKTKMTTADRERISQTERFESIKKDFDGRLNRLEEEARQLRVALPTREAQATALVTEMEEVRDKMKWTMARAKLTDGYDDAQYIPDDNSQRSQKTDARSQDKPDKPPKSPRTPRNFLRKRSSRPSTSNGSGP